MLRGRSLLPTLDVLWRSHTICAVLVLFLVLVLSTH